MKPLVAILALLSVTGCAFAPEKAYPIFRLPTTDEAKNLKQDDAQKAAFGAAFTIGESASQLMHQRLWYLHLAERRQEAVFNQSDWSLGGATLGTIGGLVKSVPTAGVGALIGGGSSMIASRYSLNGQTTIYLKAAEQTGCVWTVVGAFAAAQPADEAASGLWNAANADVARRATLGSLQIQAEVRSTLLTLSPSAVSPQDLVKLYNDYKDQKKDANRKWHEASKASASLHLAKLNYTDSSVANITARRGEHPAVVSGKGSTASDLAKQAQKDLQGVSRRNQMRQPSATPQDGTQDNPPDAASTQGTRADTNVSAQTRQKAYESAFITFTQAASDSAIAQAIVAATEIQSCVTVGKPAASL